MADHRTCPVCGRQARQFEPGPGDRPQARCGGCQSLERHRFLALLLDTLTPTVGAARLLLDVAPSRQTTSLFRGRLAPRRYVRLDFDPGADGRDVDVQASLTALPLRSGAVDVLICYHVLEHVPDDRTAMREMHRVLGHDGIAFVQVPFHPGRPTDEDPAAPAADRVRRFGQADHVRAYGDDFEDRLRSVGLDLVRFTPLEMIGPDGVDRYRLRPDEATWLVWRSDGGGGRVFDGRRIRRDLRRRVRGESPPVPRQTRRMSARLRWAASNPLEAGRRAARRLTGPR